MTDKPSNTSSQNPKLFEDSTENQKMYEFTTEGLTNLLHECIVEFYEEHATEAEKKAIARDLWLMGAQKRTNSLYFRSNPEDHTDINEFLHDIVKDVLDNK